MSVVLPVLEILPLGDLWRTAPVQTSYWEVVVGWILLVVSGGEGGRGQPSLLLGVGLAVGRAEVRPMVVRARMRAERCIVGDVLRGIG